MVSIEEQDKTYTRVKENFEGNRYIFNVRALVKGAQTAYDEGRINFGHLLSLEVEFNEAIEQLGAKFIYNLADAKQISDALDALEGIDSFSKEKEKDSKPPSKTADILPFKPK